MSDSNVKFVDLTTKKARVLYIRNMLRSNEAWAKKGLIRIYEAQTDEEQQIGVTKEYNGVGFTGADASFLTSLAIQQQTYGFLTQLQLKLLFKKMPKYAGQLERISK